MSAAPSKPGASGRNRAFGPVASFTTCPAPWGQIHLAASDGGLVAVELDSVTASFVEATAARLGGAVVPDQPGLPPAWHRTLLAAACQLAEYFDGRRTTLDVPVDLRGMSAWDRRVLEATRTIGYATVSSYGRIARLVGSPRAARAVGTALGHNPISLFIPCHRIIAGDGSLGGYGGSSHASRAAALAVKRRLLGLEGIALPARLPD